MAHKCPQCGQICYCDGDLQDMLLNDDEDVDFCIHWEECERGDDDDDDELPF